LIGNKTTIVVGAGASADLGLPTGEKLKSQISQLLYLDRSGMQYSPSPAHKEIFAGVNNYLADEEISLTDDEFYNLGNEIADNVKRAASIDNFLDNRKDDKRLVAIGKTAIAYCIAKAEDEAQLDLPNLQLERSNDYKKTNSYFLEELLKLVVRNHTIEDVNQSLANLTFIIFNYDRCIERYLDLWLSRVFGKPMYEIIMANIKFIHVYGDLGEYNGKKLTLKSSGKSLFLNPHIELPIIAKRLKLFSEQKNSEQMANIKSVLEASENILFIGFGFEEQNMEFFTLNVLGRYEDKPEVYGTAYGFSDHDIQDIKYDLANRLDYKVENMHLANCVGSNLISFQFTRKLKKSLDTFY